MDGKNVVIEIVKGGGLQLITGTYVHPDLLPYIASWAGLNSKQLYSLCVIILRTIDQEQIDSFRIKCNNMLLNIKKREKCKGFVYILYNPVFLHYGSHMYKVGFTISLDNRLKSYVSSCPEDYTYVYTTEVDGEEVEQRTHKILAPFHFAKEFFKCPLDVIKEAIETAKQTKDTNIRELE